MCWTGFIEAFTQFVDWWRSFLYFESKFIDRFQRILLYLALWHLIQMPGDSILGPGFLVTAGSQSSVHKLETNNSNCSSEVFLANPFWAKANESSEYDQSPRHVVQRVTGRQWQEAELSVEAENKVLTFFPVFFIKRNRKLLICTFHKHSGLILF